MRFIDLKGKKFSRLLVLERVENCKKRRISWLCKCDCGNEVVVSGDHIKNGHTKSCGCFRKETCRESFSTHNKTNSSEYVVWDNMRARCYNKNSDSYKLYGALGITVCDEWRSSFISFYKDIGKKPSNNYSLDRIDGKKGYYKENCRWATPKEQSRNTKSNHMITYNNKTQCLAAWAEELSMNRGTLSSRLNNLSWSIEKALTTKVRKKI